MKIHFYRVLLHLSIVKRDFCIKSVLTINPIYLFSYDYYRERMEYESLRRVESSLAARRFSACRNLVRRLKISISSRRVRRHEFIPLVPRDGTRVLSRSEGRYADRNCAGKSVYASGRRVPFWLLSADLGHDTRAIAPSWTARNVFASRDRCQRPPTFRIDETSCTGWFGNGCYGSLGWEISGMGSRDSGEWI